MTENVVDGAEAIEKGDIGHMTTWLADVVAEGTEPKESKRAVELLEKLTECKPIAKIEELEESNYKMVDNVLNNGAGEKAQKEENKKEQKRHAVRASLKARLVEKKVLTFGRGKGHDAQGNNKNNQKEIIEDIGRTIKYLEDDEMLELSKKVVAKLEAITDEEFAKLEIAAAE